MGVEDFLIMEVWKMLIFSSRKNQNRSLNYWIGHYNPLTTFLDKVTKVLLCISGPRDSDVISEVDMCRLYIYLYMNRYIYIYLSIYIIYLSIHADIIIFVDVDWIPYMYIYMYIYICIYLYIHIYIYTDIYMHTPYLDRILDDQNESR